MQRSFGWPGAPIAVARQILQDRQDKLVDAFHRSRAEEIGREIRAYEERQLRELQRWFVE